MLETLGLATVKKLAPKPRFARPKPAADLETLHAVIANRYDVLSRYAKSVQAHLRRGDGAAASRWSPRDAEVLRSLKRALLRGQALAGAESAQARRGAEELPCARHGDRHAPRAGRALGALAVLPKSSCCASSRTGAIAPRRAAWRRSWTSRLAFAPTPEAGKDPARVILSATATAPDAGAVCFSRPGRSFAWHEPALAYPKELQIMHYRTLTAGVIAALGLATSGIASAQSTTSSTTDTWRMPYQSGFWGHAGASVGQSKLQLGCPPAGSCDDKDTALRIFAGGRFNNAFGLEIGLLDFGTFDRGGGETKGRGLDIPLILGFPIGTNSSVVRQGGRRLQPDGGQRQLRRCVDWQGIRLGTALRRGRAARPDAAMGDSRRLGPLPRAVSGGRRKTSIAHDRGAIHLPLIRPFQSKRPAFAGLFWLSFSLVSL